MLGSGLWPRRLLRLGTGHSYTGNLGARVWCSQVYFQVFYFEILNLVHRTLVHPLNFSAEQILSGPICFIHWRWMFPCVHCSKQRNEVWLCRGLPNRTRGWDRWVFWEQFSLRPTRKLNEHSEDKNLVLGMRKHCSNKFQPLNPSWLCHFSWWLFIAF